MRWTDCRIVAFDTETTGLNPFDGDRVIEFGAVEIRVDERGFIHQVTPHEMLINPGIPIPRAASRVSGITDEQVADSPPFSKVAGEIRAVLEDAIIVAHNLSFDVNFIRTELERVGLHWPPTRAEVDTLPLSQRLLPELRSHRLESICGALNVTLENAHRAFHDAEACGRCLIEMANRKQAPGDLVSFLDWADALGPPPDTGHLIMGARGIAVFSGGPHQGETVEDHPDYLQWMTMALERRNGQWHPRFPDSVTQWAKAYLRNRCAGRMGGGLRSQGPADWTLDPPRWGSS
jgi:DNA polymerase III epsilon subunit